MVRRRAWRHLNARIAYVRSFNSGSSARTTRARRGNDGAQPGGRTRCTTARPQRGGTVGDRRSVRLPRLLTKEVACWRGPDTPRQQCLVVPGGWMEVLVESGSENRRQGVVASAQ
jgi:hypothetical protein